MDALQSRILDSHCTEPTEMKKVFVPLTYVVLVIVGCSTAISSNEDELRIVGGTDAVRSQFPYYAQILMTIMQNETAIQYGNCGGSVISSAFILTAAHCVNGIMPNDVRVTLGLHSIEERKGLQFYYTKAIHVHAGYDMAEVIHDIAVIEVHEKIRFTDSVQPIQLLCDYTLPGVMTLVAGTGITSDAEKLPPTTLQWTDLMTIPNQQCSQRIGLGVLETEMCAIGQPKQSACHGDSGSALIREMNGSQFQVGVVSWGVSSGCELGYPNVFTRISAYADWIKEHTHVSCVNEK